MKLFPSAFIRVAEGTVKDLRVIDRHALHGVGQVRLCPLLFLLLPSSLLLLSFLHRLLIDRSRLDKLDYFRHACKIKVDGQRLVISQRREPELLVLCLAVN